MKKILWWIQKNVLYVTKVRVSVFQANFQTEGLVIKYKAKLVPLWFNKHWFLFHSLSLG